MSGKEAIIDSIISSAENSAAALLSQANNERKELLEKNRLEEERKKDEILDKAREEAALSVSRKVSVAQLEKSKTLLAAKQELLSRVYEESVTKILNMTDNIYREFIGGFIDAYAEDGDVVSVSERDAKRLNKEWLDAAAEKKGISLTLSDKYHDGRGGIVLSGKNCDKNLVLDTMASNIKGKTEAKVSDILFR